MINNITNVDTRLQQTSVVKTAPSQVSISVPPVLGFKTPNLKEKALIRIKKVKRGDNLVMVGDIDDDYVDIVEEKIPASSRAGGTSFNSASNGQYANNGLAGVLSNGTLRYNGGGYFEGPYGTKMADKVYDGSNEIETFTLNKVLYGISNVQK